MFATMFFMYQAFCTVQPSTCTSKWFCLCQHFFVFAFQCLGYAVPCVILIPVPCLHSLTVVSQILTNINKYFYNIANIDSYWLRFFMIEKVALLILTNTYLNYKEYWLISVNIGLYCLHRLILVYSIFYFCEV